MKNNHKGKKKNSKKAPFRMEPSHLESGWNHVGWVALQNAAFSSLFAIHNSPGGWKLRESGDCAQGLSTERICNIKYRERKTLSTHAEKISR